MSNRFNQDDDDVLKRAFNWSGWLKQNETIVTAEITCDSDDLTIQEEAIDGANVVYKVSGGKAGETYMISCKIKTSGNETIQRSISLTIDKK